jgi:hypothetical protein
MGSPRRSEVKSHLHAMIAMLRHRGSNHAGAWTDGRAGLKGVPRYDRATGQTRPKKQNCRKLANEGRRRMAVGGTLEGASHHLLAEPTVVNGLCDRDGFAARYARASEPQSEAWSDEIIDGLGVYCARRQCGVGGGQQGRGPKKEEEFKRAAR